MEGKAFFNTCAAGGCHQNCALKLWVKDGKICKVESADYPNDPAERCICLRGLSSIRLVYHPDRLKYPLKRLGERGEGKWKRITWDEAFNTIASKLLEIKEKYGPQSVKIASGGSSTVGLLQGRLLGRRFANAWGSGGYLEGLGWIDDGAIAAASLLVLGVAAQGHNAQDFIHSNMVILWGWNPAVTHLRDMKFILDARDKGAKLVVIGPIFDATAAKADWHVPIRAGTDAALALAMMNVIIKEGHYDKDYIAKYTVAPFLVREDNKLFLRDANKYLVWDEKTGVAKPYDSVASPALLGSFTVRGVRCKPAFQLLVETTFQYPPEKAAEITGIPAETIRKLAIEYAASKPAAIKVGFGMSRTFNGCLNYRAVITLAAITGNIGIPGGGASMATAATSPIVLNQEGITSPHGVPGMKTIPGAQNAIRAWAAIREGKPYPIKACITAYKNPFQCTGHIDGWQEIYSQVDLIVVADIFMTRTAQYADIVLPEATVFERDDIFIRNNYILRLEKVIEPLYETKSALEIWSELGQRVGLGKYFDYTIQDYMQILLDADHSSIAGITLERLDKEKIVRGNMPLTPVIPFANKEFPTRSGRIEFYQERLAEFSEELPIHKEGLESPRSSPLAQKYPLTFFTLKCKTTTHSLLPNVDWMQEMAPRAVLDINPSDARRRGIKDADVVVVFNDRGKAKLKAKLNEAIPPGAVNVDHGWWPQQFIEGHYNDLLHRIDDLSIVSPSLEIEPIISDSQATAALIFFDCLVEVKKA